MVVTIIVLLILASVAINLTVGNNGIFTRAQNAVDLYNNAAEKEKIAMNEFVNIFDNIASGNEKNQLLLDTADVEGNIILAAGIQNISKEMMDDIYKTRQEEILQESVDVKENCVIGIYSILLSLFTGENVSTEEEVLKVMYENKMIDKQYESFEEAIKNENPDMDYEEFLDNMIREDEAFEKMFLFSATTIEKPDGEVINYVLGKYDEENQGIVWISRVNQMGVYKVQVKLTNEKIFNGEIEVKFEKKYEIKITDTASRAYLMDKEIQKYVEIEKAYVNIDNQKSDVSQYLEKTGDGLYSNFLNLGKLYNDGVTGHKIPFEIELIKYDKSVKAMIEQEPIEEK